jgi:hypothetical protein
MNTKKIDIKLSELLNDLQNGHTWLQHEDVGYGSIQEKYAANELQIKMIQKHPKLSDVKPNITIFNIIDDLENETIYIKEVKEPQAEIINSSESDLFLNI